MAERSHAEDREFTLMERTMAQMGELTSPAASSPPAAAREDLRTRGQIEAVTDKIKYELEEIGEQTRERAWVIEQDGLVLGQGEQRLFTGGMHHAPKIHPVWSDELHYETNQARSMGEPIVFGLPWNYHQP